MAEWPHEVLGLRPLKGVTRSSPCMIGLRPGDNVMTYLATLWFGLLAGMWLQHFRVRKDAGCVHRFSCMACGIRKGPPLKWEEV